MFKKIILISLICWEIFTVNLEENKYNGIKLHDYTY